MIRKRCMLDTDFQRSMTFQRDVEVWIREERVIVGRVESFTAEVVRIEGNDYVRESSEFIMV